MKHEGLSGKFLKLIGIIAVIWFFVWVCQTIYSKANPESKSVASSSETAAPATVPWDYQIQEAKVSSIDGGDLILTPGNGRISNDQNLAIGDSLWVMDYKQATTDADGKSTVSDWNPIKTFKTKEDAEKDLSELKVEIKTDVKLIGVYKTELSGKFRYFAVVELPTGQAVKQPVTEAIYTEFKSKKEVGAVLEEVHDYNNYDESMAKFRGWAQ
ncbi:signal peptide protein [Paenibacillus oryzisoli]|uniref:signal peptide protein n=1 Tax=Paenibacillus oryzisoli TaxID=1850517 RepID=UPI003D2E78FD